MADLNRYKETVERELELLAKMRDELKVQLHLAKADAKDEWERLEKRFQGVQQELVNLRSEAKQPLQEAQNAGRELLAELKRVYERVRDQLGS